MSKTAVLLTVFNRKETTLHGLYSLYKAIKTLGGGYEFDIYMTDDGCTDGTSDAVRKEFPDIHIVKGNGSLYWGGGMRKAWQTAIDSGINYDYFLWYNDDNELYDNALLFMFEAIEHEGPNCIITGAFQDHEGNPSYGGKTGDGRLLAPNGSFQDVVLMNGNLVLIPLKVFSVIGMIDGIFKHGLGDYDYGLSAMNSNFKVKLTAYAVGVCDRHDELIPCFFSVKYPLFRRLRLLYSPKYCIFSYLVYFMRHEGLFYAIKDFCVRNYFTLFPQLLKR